MLVIYFIIFIVVNVSNQKINDRECVVHEDCPNNGAYCNEGHCKCFDNYVEIDNHCWKSLNPEEYGCFFNEQCSSAWPNATCVLSKCSCPEGEISTKTRYGYVCHKRMHCPFNGDKDILYEGGINIPTKCSIISSSKYKLLKNGNSLSMNETKLEYLGCDADQKLYDCIEGKCCPSPELTCTQPLDYGYSDNSTPIERYYYHKITGTCQKFYYKGNGGNSNNFKDKFSCDVYCGNIASRSVKSKINSSFLAKKKVLLSKELLCNDKIELNELKSKSKKVTSYSQGILKYLKNQSIRWYWDRKIKSCLPFSYYGQPDDLNNFISLIDCEEFCSPLLCPNGRPLKIDGIGNLKCSTNKDCPESYYCYDKVCCPTPAIICNQRKLEGSKCLVSPIKRYFYNVDSENCETFTYNGCHRNDNNFESFEDCIKTCDNVEKHRVCPYGEPYQSRVGVSLKCKINSLSNHHYLNTKSNNTSSANYKSKKVEYNKVNTNINLSCPNNYYCHNDSTSFDYQICCPKPTFTCKLPVNEGIHCLPTPIIKYFYNFELKQCLPFMFRGCGGNSNKFNTKHECHEHCEKNNFIEKTFQKLYKDTVILKTGRKKKKSKSSKKLTFEQKIYKLFFKKYSPLINFPHEKSNKK
uniref:BPTI/Kunitz inhibitor domain-containing protein n=1 Tax=Strongyloides papillosus TaxID=174720 RepID=A0A0N5BTA3_STREA